MCSYKYSVPHEDLEGLYQTVEIENTLRRRFNQPALFYNLNERNDPEGPYLRFVLDVDQPIADDEIEPYIVCVYNEIKKFMNSDSRIHFTVLRRDDEIDGRVHIHFLNVIVCEGVFVQLIRAIRQTIGRASAVDPSAGRTFFLVYGSGKKFPGKNSKIRHIPYTINWWGSYDPVNGLTRSQQEPDLKRWRAVNVAHLLSLRRPVVPQEDVIATKSNSASRRNVAATKRRTLTIDAGGEPIAKRLRSDDAVEDDDDHHDDDVPEPSTSAESTTATSVYSSAQIKFARLLVNSWSDKAVEYDSWFRVLCAIANTLGRYDAKLAKTLMTTFSKTCPSKFDADARNKIQNILRDVTTNNDRPRRFFIHEIPFTADERALEQKVIRGISVHRGRSEWYRHLSEYIFGDVRVVRVVSPTNAHGHLLLTFSTEEYCYIIFNEKTLTEMYRPHRQGVILDFYTKLLCKYFNDRTQFDLIYETRKAFEENHESAPRELFQRIPYVSVSPREFDARKTVMAFINGIFDLNTAKFIPRDDPQHAAYILSRYNLAVNHNIVDPDNEDVQADMEYVTKILSQIIPDMETRRVFLRWMTKCLVTGNTWRSFLIFRGKRRNGKTLLQKIINYAFNSPYLFINIQPSAMQSNPNALMTDFANCLGEERILMLSEFSFACTDKAYNQMKSITGCDQIQYRIPYDKMTCSHEIMGQVIITTNADKSEFHFTPQREAVIDRVRIFPFTSLFVTAEEYRTCDEASINDNGEHVFLEDPSLFLTPNLVRLGRGLINLLIISYTNLCEMNKSQEGNYIDYFINRGPLNDSLRMRNAKIEILQACDDAYQFCKSHLSYEAGSEQCMSIVFKMYTRTRKRRTDSFTNFTRFQEHVWSIIRRGWLGESMRKHVSRRVVSTRTVDEVYVLINCKFSELVDFTFDLEERS